MAMQGARAFEADEFKELVSHSAIWMLPMKSWPNTRTTKLMLPRLLLVRSVHKKSFKLLTLKAEIKPLEKKWHRRVSSDV